MCSAEEYEMLRQLCYEENYNYGEDYYEVALAHLETFLLIFIIEMLFVLILLHKRIQNLIR